MSDQSEVLFVGGRTGVGKSSVGNEIHIQLAASGIWHGFIEGDNLDMAYPPPWEHRLAERNLAAMWRNYRALGYRRMIYTNTVSVRVVDELTAAMGGDPRVTAVLLTCSDATARQRLAEREIGSALQPHIDRGLVFARELEELAPSWVYRVATDDRSVADVSAEIIGLTGWAAHGE
ncbi:MAG: hypothetical protein WB622_03650 [Acidobacteriaceae bacterium]